jgi:hypothetical protein
VGQGISKRLPPLTPRRTAITLSLLLALASTGYVLYRPSFWPPALHSRSLAVGTASVELMVAPANLAVGTADADVTEVDHSILVGDLMSTPPVIDYAASQLGISPSAIQASSPMTANVPRVVIEPGSGAAAYSLAGSTDSYKLEVQADPFDPILYVYTQAPTIAAAVRLASASVSGLVRYVATTMPRHMHRTPAATEIEQLGPIRGAIGNAGAGKEIAVLVFLGVFGVASWLMLIGARIRRRWSAARLALRVSERRL